MRPELRKPGYDHHLPASTYGADQTWLVSEDQRADRKDGRADPDQDGSLLFRNVRRLVHNGLTGF